MSWSRFVCPHCHFNSRPSARGDLLRGKYAQGVHNFNSRPSARGDVLHVVYSFHSRYFNSRPSARGDTRLRKLYIYTNLFQFTPLREGRLPCLSQNIVSAVFQFTPLREGRQLRRSPCSPPSSNFNSRPSARGDAENFNAKRLFDISIHAPPRGATRRRHARAQVLPISIHAPPRGATNMRRLYIMRRGISIHAPPRGATGILTREAYKTLFQFTPLREGRPSRRSLWAAMGHFNSRPSARGDAAEWLPTYKSEVFQFTPLREGRPEQEIIMWLEYKISIHAPPRGATARYWRSRR